MISDFFQWWEERICPIFTDGKFPIEENIKQRLSRYQAVCRAISGARGKYGHDRETRIKDQVQTRIVFFCLELALQKFITFSCIQAWRVWILIVWAMFLFLRYTPLIKGVKVRGKKNVRKRRRNAAREIYASRHPSLLEPALLPITIGMPEMIIWPSRYFPWQTPNKKIMKDPFLMFGRLSPLIPVGSDENGMPNDGSILPRILEKLEDHPFIIFPEGTRSEHGLEPRRVTASGAVISSPLWGIGLLIYKAYKNNKQQPLIVTPVFVRGAEYVFPIGKPPWVVVWNILFRHRIEIIFGKQIDFSWFHEYTNNERRVKKEERKELYHRISEQVMDAIIALDN